MIMGAFKRRKLNNETLTPTKTTVSIVSYPRVPGDVASVDSLLRNCSLTLTECCTYYMTCYIQTGNLFFLYYGTHSITTLFVLYEESKCAWTYGCIPEFYIEYIEKRCTNDGFSPDMVTAHSIYEHFFNTWPTEEDLAKYDYFNILLKCPTPLKEHIDDVMCFFGAMHDFNVNRDQKGWFVQCNVFTDPSVIDDELRLLMGTNTRKYYCSHEHFVLGSYNRLALKWNTLRIWLRDDCKFTGQIFNKIK